MRGQFRSMFNRVRDIYLNRLTETRAGALDFLDARISTLEPEEIAADRYMNLKADISIMRSQMNGMLSFAPRCKVILTAGIGSFVVPGNTNMLDLSYCGGGGRFGGGAAVIGVVVPVFPGDILSYNIGAGYNGDAFPTTISLDGFTFLTAGGGGQNTGGKVNGTELAFTVAGAGTVVPGGVILTGAGRAGCALAGYAGAGLSGLYPGATPGNPGCLVIKWHGAEEGA